jgi:hypothetical protein
VTDQVQIPVAVLEALVEMSDKLAQMCDVSPSHERSPQKAEAMLAARRKHMAKKAEAIAERTEQTKANPGWGTWG